MPVVVQRRMHSPRVSRSSTSPSWRRGRFPWSSEQIMRFPCCSPLIRWSIFWFSGREESVEIPQLLLVVAWTPLLTCPLVCNNRCWVLIVLGRALCTGTGPLFDPRHQGGEGVAGTPGVLTPRCSATQINCMLIGVYGETHMSYNIVCTTTTTTEHEHSRSLTAVGWPIAFVSSGRHGW